jgi:hypothetical protein
LAIKKDPRHIWECLGGRHGGKGSRDDREEGGGATSMAMDMAIVVADWNLKKSIS